MNGRFSYLRSNNAPSHSSCPISLSIVNLPPHLRSVPYLTFSLVLLPTAFSRYRTANLLLVGIIPGPREPNPDEVQKFLCVLVNELLRLWYHGFMVKTRKYPNGRRARLVLVGVICDKPAAHKLGGFGSHSHTFFCTFCWIEQSKKATDAAFEKDGTLEAYFHL